ncbi:MAG: hypothetical protein F6K30_15355 [Cyanothece sp. SIO2G6]|nr:hypothetical protein [Cyanothece sp. SIO2G6]
MFQSPSPGAAASPVPSATSSLSGGRLPQYESVRHMVFGSVAAVERTIKLLYKLNYAEPNDWSKPIPTGQPNEVVVVLTKRVRV